MMKKICVIAMVLGVSGALHRLKDYKNKAVVLNSVYDAMKDNLRQSNSLERRDIFIDPRNKRDAQQETEYYDSVPSESVNEWSVAPAYGNDLVCSRRNEAQTRITVSDHSSSSGLTIALIVKYALLVLAALTLPIFIFKIFIIPFKLLVGLKAISLLNSVLLGTLLLKSKIGKFGWPGMGPGYPYPGAAPASSASSSASASSSSASSDSLERDEYVDIVQPGEDLKRILEYVKTRNKNW